MLVPTQRCVSSCARVKLIGFAAGLILLGIACRTAQPSLEAPTELPETRRTENPELSTIAVPEDFQIRLERSEEMKPGRVYSITILGSGRVQFEGTRNVEVIGQRVSHIPADQVIALARLVDTGVFWCLGEEDLSYMNHVPVTTLSVRSAGRQRTLRFCWAWGYDVLTPRQGARSEGELDLEATEELSRIADMIECVSGAYQWIGALPGQ